MQIDNRLPHAKGKTDGKLCAHLERRTSPFCLPLSQGRKREIAKRVIHVRFGEASRRSAIAAERNEAEEHNRRLLVHFPISCRDKLAIVKLCGWKWFPSRLQFNGRLSSLSMAMIVRWTIITMAC